MLRLQCLALPVLSIFVTASPVAAAGAASAAAGHLWHERSASSAPLAQVPDFRALAQQLIPAVVSIQVEQRVKSAAQNPSGPGMPQDPLDYFHRYFGGDVPREFHNRGLGSGFILDAEGLILTNYHVVEDAANIEVTVAAADGSERKVQAKVLGTAPEYDVALLQTTDALTGAQPTFLGDSDGTQIGDWVMAVGNPFGLTHSVSVGIISAKERREVAPSGRQGLYNFLQTDASINPGNSGGPLVNMRGEVIGINSAVNATGGIGFAIPINMVKEMLPDLKAKGRYARSWLGIKIQSLTPELSQTYGLKRTAGALVAEVVPSGPAAAAQIREGDIILSFNGRELRQSSDLPLFASMAGVGKKVPLKVWRDGRELNLQVTLAEFPGEAANPVTISPNEAGQLGLVASDITPMLQQQLNLDERRGVIVKELSDTGPAARAGLRPGDVIININNQDIPNMQVFAEQVRRVKSQEMLRVKIVRHGQGLFVAIKKP